MVTIYSIINRHNKKRYIGSTAQKVEARWGQHKRELRKGTHPTEHLQRAWDRYGEQAFLFVVLQVVTTKERRWAEQKAIDEWIAEAGREALYNASDKVSAVTTAASREKVSQINRERWARPEYREARREATAERGRSWAATEEGRARLEAMQAGQRVWAASEEGRHKMASARAMAVAARAKTVPGLRAPDGRVYPSITNLNAFCREHGLGHTGVHNVITGRSKSYKGWTRYEEE